MKPHDFSLLEDLYNKNISLIINGNRGTGKTILIKEISRISKHGGIICVIDNFETVSLNDNQEDYYELILKNIVHELLLCLLANKKMAKILSEEDKILLSYLVYRYGKNISENEVANKIESIQLSLYKRIANKFSSVISFFLNYGATAATRFGNELLSKHFNYLPNITEGSISKIFPDLHFDADKSFVDLNVSYDILDRVLKLIKKLRIDRVVLFIDKLDEDKRLDNDADEIQKFIEALFVGNNLLLNENIQLIISVWKIPFDNLGSKFRRQKHSVYDTNWSIDELKKVLNQRLKAHSNSKLTNYERFFDSSVPDEDINKIFILANACPRDLWHIFDHIFKSQYNIDNTSLTLTRQAISQGINNFVVKFDFYEYYPKKKNARKNTNDVYTYMQHLLKLPSYDFTHGELREFANTGGSTTNYISGMTSIGLVQKTDIKREGGAVVYKIIDPKVNFAIENKLSIGKSEH